MVRLFYILVLLSFLLYGIVSANEDWQVLKGEHFLVYYKEDPAFMKEVLRYAERYYDTIAGDLGYSRHDKFWQWDNRVKIYIYNTHQEFCSALGKPEWVHGTARYNEKEIITYRWNENFLSSLLPHEMAHLIFRDFVGFPAHGGGIPLWLDEGVAQWEEKDKRRIAIGIVKKLIKDNEYIRLSTLMEMDVRRGADFTLSRNFYAQAVSLVGFLIEKYNGSRFTLFCRQLRDGKSIDEALSFVYTHSIHNVGELEEKWVRYYK